MVQLSAMVLAIGVPVAKTMPPPRSSSHSVFRNRSVALWHSAGLGKPFTRSSLVANGRFFPQCASSTSLLASGAKRPSRLVAGAPLCGVHVGNATEWAAHLTDPATPGDRRNSGDSRSCALPRHLIPIRAAKRDSSVLHANGGVGLIATPS